MARGSFSILVEMDEMETLLRAIREAQAYPDHDDSEDTENHAEAVDGIAGQLEAAWGKWGPSTYIDPWKELERPGPTGTADLAKTLQSIRQYVRDPDRQPDTGETQEAAE